MHQYLEKFRHREPTVRNDSEAIVSCSLPSNASPAIRGDSDYDGVINLPQRRTVTVRGHRRGQYFVTKDEVTHAQEED